MTWVKICGMTNLEDALVAVDAGADAVGFVFYEKSPRCVTVERAREIVEKLPEEIEKVGVFVGASPEGVAEVLRQAGLTVAQIYPRKPHLVNDEFLRRVSSRVIPAIATAMVSEDEIHGFHVSGEMRYQIMAALLDSGSSERPGGTGEKFDWDGMSDQTNRIGCRFVVAGGLTSENVCEAIRKMKPWGVDVSSGVEVSPGKKDPDKVRAFVRAVREMDRKAS